MLPHQAPRLQRQNERNKKCAYTILLRSCARCHLGVQGLEGLLHSFPVFRVASRFGLFAPFPAALRISSDSEGRHAYTHARESAAERKAPRCVALDVDAVMQAPAAADGPNDSRPLETAAVAGAAVSGRRGAKGPRGSLRARV
ncbi:hypothetical protein MRX96_036840 [Rhipicephalus microplus]